MTPSDIDRFWSKVAIGEPEECWEWQAARDPNGYGRFSIGGRRGSMKLAHRVSMSLAQDVPAGLSVLHSCDNPPCVNVAHLRVGTVAENMADMAERLRSGRKKLTPDEVREIRKLAAEGVPQRAIARRFSVQQGTIHYVLSGATWRHVEAS